MNEAFFHLYSNLPRQGPGSAASTRQALGALPPLGDSPRVLDLGCGPGAQTLVLAEALQSPIVAVDNYQPYLDELAARSRAAGLEHLVTTRCVSMDAIDEPAGTVDLIWSEGAIYIVGVERGLRLWRPLLRSGGLVAFSELSWLTSEPPAGVAEFFKSCYPAMADVAGNIARAEAAGYRVLHTFAQPESDWWDEYYTPLRAKATRLRASCEPGSDLEAVLTETEEEIRILEVSGGSYGYVFYLLQKLD